MKKVFKEITIIKVNGESKRVVKVVCNMPQSRQYADSLHTLKAIAALKDDGYKLSKVTVSKPMSKAEAWSYIEKLCKAVKEGKLSEKQLMEVVDAYLDNYEL